MSSARSDAALLAEMGLRRIAMRSRATSDSMRTIPGWRLYSTGRGSPVGKPSATHSASGDFQVLAPTVCFPRCSKSRRSLPDGATKAGGFAVSSVRRKRLEGWRIIYSHESTTHSAVAFGRSFIGVLRRGIRLGHGCIRAPNEGARLRCWRGFFSARIDGTRSYRRLGRCRCRATP